MGGVTPCNCINGIKVLYPIRFFAYLIFFKFTSIPHSFVFIPNSIHEYGVMTKTQWFWKKLLQSTEKYIQVLSISTRTKLLALKQAPLASMFMVWDNVLKVFSENNRTHRCNRSKQHLLYSTTLSSTQRSSLRAYGHPAICVTLHLALFSTWLTTLKQSQLVTHRQNWATLNIKQARQKMKSSFSYKMMTDCVVPLKYVFKTMCKAMFVVCSAPFQRWNKYPQCQSGQAHKHTICQSTATL